MQRDAMDEDDLLQGKFAVQRDVEDEDELLQGKILWPNGKLRTRQGFRIM